jgi:hypothetical protein
MQIVASIHYPVAKKLSATFLLTTVSLQPTTLPCWLTSAPPSATTRSEWQRTGLVGPGDSANTIQCGDRLMPAARHRPAHAGVFRQAAQGRGNRSGSGGNSYNAHDLTARPSGLANSTGRVFPFRLNQDITLGTMLFPSKLANRSTEQFVDHPGGFHSRQALV